MTFREIYAKTHKPWQGFPPERVHIYECTGMVFPLAGCLRAKSCAECWDREAPEFLNPIKNDKKEG